MKVYTQDYVFETLSGTDDFVFKVLTVGSEEVLCSSNICMIHEKISEPSVFIHSREFRFVNADYICRAMELLIRNVNVIWNEMDGKTRKELIDTGYLLP